MEQVRKDGVAMDEVTPGLGWPGNPVKGIKPPPGREWMIVGTWPPSDSAGISLQMSEEAVQPPSAGSNHSKAES
jgi:hypothetical protein